jgi:hypothetical protein
MEVASGRRLNDAETEADRLSTTPRHLRELIRRGMPHVALGGKVRFDPDLTDAWLVEQQRVRRAT